MKPWHWAVLALVIVLLVLWAVPQTHCTLTGGDWRSIGEVSMCFK